jgi:hypothetical protein
MNAKLKLWIVDKYCKLDPQRKNKFLFFLKSSPEKTLHDIASLLPQWRLDYIILTGEATACCDHTGEPQEILEALSVYFVKQLIDAV